MLVILPKGFPIKKPKESAKNFHSRIYLYIFSNILLVFLSMATIVGESGAVGVIGQQFAMLNLSIFGYIGYVYLLFLLYPVYYFYKHPALTFHKLELIIAWLLGFVSLLLAQSLLFSSGLFGNNVVRVLQDFIGVFGVWVLVVGCLLLSVLVATQSNVDTIFRQSRLLLTKIYRALLPLAKHLITKLWAMLRAVFALLYTIYVLGKMLIHKISSAITNIIKKSYQACAHRIRLYAQARKEREKERIEHLQAIHALSLDSLTPHERGLSQEIPNPSKILNQGEVSNPNETPNKTPNPSQTPHITESHLDTQYGYTGVDSTESSAELGLDPATPTYATPDPHQPVIHQHTIDSTSDLHIELVQNHALDSEALLQKHIQEFKERYDLKSHSQTPQYPAPQTHEMIQEVLLPKHQEITQDALNNAYKTAYYGAQVAPKTQPTTQPNAPVALDIQAIISNSHQANFTKAPKTPQPKQPNQNAPKDSHTPQIKPTKPKPSSPSTAEIISSLAIQEIHSPEIAPSSQDSPSHDLDSHDLPLRGIESTPQNDTLTLDSQDSHIPTHILDSRATDSQDSHEPQIEQPSQSTSSPESVQSPESTPTQPHPSDSTQPAHTQPISEPDSVPKAPRAPIVRELEENTALLKNLDFGKRAAPINFKLPPTSLLNQPDHYKSEIDEVEIDTKSEILLAKLKTFKIDGDVVRTYTGPIVTTFEFRPAPNVKVSRILNLEDDIALALSAKSIRIQAPVPGKDVVGIEIPNNTIETIFLREVLESELFKSAQSPLALAFGKDIVGNPFIQDLRKLPHLLIAGTTGSGKSVGLNAMILSLLYRNSPDSLKLMMIDPKRVEFALYSDIPHLITPIITDPKKAIVGLNNAMHEMDRRYEKMKDMRVKDIEGYNKKAREEGEEEMQYFVIVIDELADLMQTSGREAEAPLSRIAQMGRACGMHLIIATQRPSVDVVTGTLKGNLPSRISYKVGSKVDSKVILDDVGAASLLGRGDMLFKISDTIMRLHAPFSTEAEIESVVEFLKSQREPQYDKSFLLDDKEQVLAGGESKDEGDEDMLEQIKRFMLESGNTSSSSVQRRFSIGFNRATNYVEQLEKEGFLSKRNAKGVREIIR